jgi:UDP-GlcNAc:undecaprenyl-phosphate GlcNAc-1-phosphate transferase
MELWGMELSGFVYAAVFIGSFLLCWLLTPLMLRLALRRNILDLPVDRKAHSSPVPYLGGVAIVAAFSIALLGGALWYRPVAGLTTLATAVGVGLVLSVMGLVDDLSGLSPWLRLALEVAAGVTVWLVGAGVTLLGPGWLNAIVTVFWVVGITNAFNLLDNMDGLSAGVAFVAAAAFFFIAALGGQFLVAALAVAVGGCALGFLRHNFYPARIYMGDAGSLFLGFMLAFIGVRLRLVSTPPFVALFVPILVLAVPIFDTALVTVNRLRHGRSPMAGGRDHTSHRLVFVGVPVPVAVTLIYGVAVGLGWLAVLLARLDVVSGLLLVGFVSASGAFMMGLLNAVPVYENSRQRDVMIRVVRTDDSQLRQQREEIVS